jgi:hypothetical protein
MSWRAGGARSCGGGPVPMTRACYHPGLGLPGTGGEGGQPAKCLTAPCLVSIGMYRQNAVADRISTAFPCWLHRRCAVTSRSSITLEGELAAAPPARRRPAQRTSCPAVTRTGAGQGAIHATPTSRTQPLAGSAPMPSALNKKNTYATWARLAMTSMSATMIAQPPAHPDRGPNARVAQVKVVPQSGSALPANGSGTRMRSPWGPSGDALHRSRRLVRRTFSTSRTRGLHPGFTRQEWPEQAQGVTTLRDRQVARPTTLGHGRPVRTSPVTSSSVRGVTSAGGRDGFPDRSKTMASRGDVRGSR